MMTGTSILSPSLVPVPVPVPDRSDDTDMLANSDDGTLSSSMPDAGPSTLKEKWGPMTFNLLDRWATGGLIRV